MDVRTLTAGSVTVHVLPDAESGGRAATDTVIAAALKARERGQRVVFWLMAAPSAFEFYEAFAVRAATEPPVAALARDATYFQFDDYPIGRESDRFPVTFRHLLEEHFAGPVREAAGGLGTFHYLELTGEADEDTRIMLDYRTRLQIVLDDPGTTVIEVKGIGMDGHWAFHGAETPLDAPPDIVRVPMGEANRHQQMRDWPQYFRTVEEIPTHAVTCTVALLLHADIIVDIAPQPEKAYAVLACYADERVVSAVPSSALKQHPGAHSFVTAAAAAPLEELRRLRNDDPGARLPKKTVETLRRLWDDPADPARSTRHVAAMMRVLRRVGVA